MGAEFVHHLPEAYRTHKQMKADEFAKESVFARYIHLLLALTIGIFVGLFAGIGAVVFVILYSAWTAGRKVIGV